MELVCIFRSIFDFWHCPFVGELFNHLGDNQWFEDFFFLQHKISPRKRVRDYYFFTFKTISTYFCYYTQHVWALCWNSPFLCVKLWALLLLDFLVRRGVSAFSLIFIENPDLGGSKEGGERREVWSEKAQVYFTSFYSGRLHSRSNWSWFFDFSHLFIL